MSFQERPKVTRNRLIKEHYDYEPEFGNNLPKHPPSNLLMENMSPTPMHSYPNFCYQEKDDKSSNSFIHNKSYIDS